MINVELDSNLTDTLAELAAAQQTTPEAYAADVLNSHCRAHLQRVVVQRVEMQPISSLKEMSVSIDAIDRKNNPEVLKKSEDTIEAVQ